jgi:hypothetical protein
MIWDISKQTTYALLDFKTPANSSSAKRGRGWGKE